MPAQPAAVDPVPHASYVCRCGSPRAFTSRTQGTPCAARRYSGSARTPLWLAPGSRLLVFTQLSGAGLVAARSEADSQDLPQRRRGARLAAGGAGRATQGNNARAHLDHTAGGGGAVAPSGGGGDHPYPLRRPVQASSATRLPARHARQGAARTRPAPPLSPDPHPRPGSGRRAGRAGTGAERSGTRSCPCARSTGARSPANR